MPVGCAAKETRLKTWANGIDDGKSIQNQNDKYSHAIFRLEKLRPACSVMTAVLKLRTTSIKKTTSKRSSAQNHGWVGGTSSWKAIATGTAKTL